MAKAMTAWASTPEGRAATARGDLWEALPRIRETIEKLLRIAKLHGQSTRLPYRERDMTRDAQQAAITTLAHLSTIETRAQPLLAAEGGKAPRATGASAGHPNDGEQKGHSPSPHMSAGK